ncbi:MAG: chromosome segregation protein SMC, partial [Verrucomicrobia bacterium]|nr:chromosome segregation protein SMC [Verrucomicrobiota bacterium]
RAEVLSATQNLAAVQTELRSAQRQIDEIASRHARMEADLAGLEQARNEAHLRWEKAQAGLAAADTAAATQRERIRQLEARLAETRTARDVKRESLGQARLELAERRQKVEVIDRGLGEMERRRQQLSELLLQRQTEIETWTEQCAELERESGAQRARAGELGTTLVVAQDQVEKTRIELAEVERTIGEIESAQHTVREESEAAHEELSAQEVKLAENRQRLQFLAEEVLREFQTAVSAIDWKRQLWHADDEPEGVRPLDLDEEDDEASSASAGEGARPAEAAPAEPAPRRRRKKKEPRGEPTAADLQALDATDWIALKAEVEALRQRLHSLGAVNLVAIEEYAELKQRHDFLAAQVSDLTAAKAGLIQAIDEINQTSLRQFQVTFEQIRKNFEYTFHTLFGGGRAQLELMQSEDILESGIEIVAQPPGTRLKGISLLSGGQKTLTAVALLFALYMVKPSPFCLLDELDAPLDESNIGRFTDLLRKFVRESQFIIITHNKRTVAAAQAIYGVTMEERGVSKTVSMRFNHERGEAEAHAPNLAEAVSSVTPSNGGNGGAGAPAPA